MRTLVPILLIAACSACPGGGFQPPKTMPNAEQVIAKLEAGRATAKSFRAETISDYWLGSERLKGEVRMMGTPGAKVRFHALSPAGGDILLDLACDGASFVYLDKQNNCALTGPCNGASIAQLMRVPLEPDDFVYLALGQTPVLPGATGTVTWDSKHGHELVELTAGGGSQSIVIDARDGRWDVIKSELRGSDGKMIWLVENKDFAEVTAEDSTKMRVPGASRFRSPGEKSDVIVEWKTRVINGALPDAAFVLPSPEGLPTCGAATPTKP